MTDPQQQPEPPNGSVVIDCKGTVYHRNDAYLDEEGEGLNWLCAAVGEWHENWKSLLWLCGPVTVLFQPDETPEQALAALQQMRATDPHPQRTACTFPDCRLSAEEHHRINAGLRVEMAELRRALAAAQ